MATHTTFRENFLRIIAVIGLIAILLLGAWGIIQLAFYLPTFFSNFGKTKEAITVTVPAQSTSDKAFALGWKHAGKDDAEYSYSASYSCAQGLQFAAPVPTGEYQLIPCNTQFNYINATSTMPVIPVLAAGTQKATTTLTLTATRLSDGVVSVKGTANTTVSASTTSTTVTPTTKPVTPKPAATKPSSSAGTIYVPSGRTTNLFGYPDLAVQITSAPQAANVGGRVTLKFSVTNVGTNATPAGWSFIAQLPYNPVYTYPSGPQQMLYPGDMIIYTLGYDVVPAGGRYGTAQASIQVDPNNQIQETIEYNNAANVTYQVY
ncbi:MAG: Peptidase sortase-like protein [Candidatus Adlerbacteria bacterium]|nr:Peptidase sortase-like protein [Candidatus Adlerbacteria bacterium]